MTPELADTQLPEERLAEGTQVGEYRIEAHAGAGAMGDVYRAVHPVIGKRVAIKVIKRKLAGSDEAKERFVREARTANRVDHPNVVDVFAIGQLPDGRLWLAMDFLDGEPLGRRLRESGRPMPPEKVVHLLRPVCAALDAAHFRGVVHRDLKSDNIFVTRDGRVVVVDFGIAKVVTGAATPADTALTAEGSWIGTPAYMAPEQWTAEGAQASSDLYALGIVAYELLTGHPPFRGGTLPAIMEQHFRAAPPPLGDIGLSSSQRRAASWVIARALAKKPEDRFPSAGAFLAALEEALGKRRPPIGTLVALGGAVMVVGAGVLAFLPHDHRDLPAAVAEDCVVSVISRPSGATVQRHGRNLGIAPFVLRAPPGQEVALRLVRNGYRPTEARAVASCPAVAVEIDLVPERGFEGIWRLPTGSLRLFERDGERVAAYELADRDAAPKLLRHFELQPGSALAPLVFSAEEEHVDPRAPDAPSCRIPLEAEYRYDPATDRLELRRQEVDVVFRAGACALERPPVWTPFAPAERIAGAEALVRRVSSQGAGPPPAQVQGEVLKKKKAVKPAPPKEKFAPASNAIPQQVAPRMKQVEGGGELK